MKADGTLDVSLERTPYGEFEADLPAAPHNILGLHLGGRCTLDWNTGSHPLLARPTRGDMTLTPTGRSGRLRVRGSGCEVLKMVVPDTALRAWADDQERPQSSVALVDRFARRDPLIQQLGLTLLAEVERPGTADHLYRDALSIALLAHLVRRHSEDDAVETSLRRPSKLTDGRARRVIEFMEADLTKRIGLEEIAREIGLSTSYFANQFTRTFGRSPARYLTWLRLERARELMADDKLTIAEIALSVGFTTASHFSQAFRLEFGVTPSSYRNR